VTDLGGFVASTFKRGMDFINVPTSLLSMVDASVGGKTGVDLGTLKNLIGVINNPEMVLIDGAFLATLSQEELRSGLAEMYKHGLIADKKYWNQLKDLSLLTHAIESYCLAEEHKTTLLHGEAIAIGMILESYVSVNLAGLDKNELEDITMVFNSMYDHVSFDKKDIDHIIEYLKYDKKNTNGQVNFVLLEAIGKPVIDKVVPNELIFEAFEYYENLNQ